MHLHAPLLFARRGAVGFPRVSRAYMKLSLALSPMIAIGLAQPVSAKDKYPPQPPIYYATVPAQVEPAPAPLPAAPPKRSSADLQKLAAPIALYPDPLIAVLLPAVVYPVEIVQAARFVRDTNNLSHIDEQVWDKNVKALAKFPEVIEKMDKDLAWMSDLGRAFEEQPVELMAAIQELRSKASSVGSLKSTPEQTVTVTNAIVERAFDQQVVYVTNQVVTIQPANPQVIYVPQYNPNVVYAPPPEPAPVDPWVPLLTFGAGLAVGAIIANNWCDWHYGGVYYGGGFVVWGGGWGHPCYYPPPYGCHPPPYYPPSGYYPGAPPPGVPHAPGTPPPGYSPGPGFHQASAGAASSPAQPQRLATSTSASPAAAPVRWQPDRTKANFAAATSPTASPNYVQRGWGTPSTAAASAASHPASASVAPASRLSGSGAGFSSRPMTPAYWPGGSAGFNGGARAPSQSAARSFGPSPGAGALSSARASAFAAGRAAHDSGFSGNSTGASAWNHSQRGATSRSLGAAAAAATRSTGSHGGR